MISVFLLRGDWQGAVKWLKICYYSFRGKLETNWNLQNHWNPSLHKLRGMTVPHQFTVQELEKIAIGSVVYNKDWRAI